MQYERWQGCGERRCRQEWYMHREAEGQIVKLQSAENIVVEVM